MIASTRTTICFLIVLSFASCVFSIKCFYCRSNLEPKCADPFDNSSVPIMDCSTQESRLPSVCRKTGQKVNGVQVIVRDCAWQRPDDNTSSCPSNSNGILFCTTCNERDGCNGAAAIGKTIALLLAPLSLLLIK